MNRVIESDAQEQSKAEDSGDFVLSVWVPSVGDDERGPRCCGQWKGGMCLKVGWQ